MMRRLSLVVLLFGCSGSSTEDATPPADRPDASLETSVDAAEDAADARDDLGSEAGPRGECADYEPLKRPFFGDLHDHTSWSLDAYGVGNQKNGPAEAYAFAAGGELTLHDGTKVRLERKLDFLAVTDHSEFFDVMGQCTLPRSDGTLDDSLYCRNFRSLGMNPGSPATLRFAQLALPSPTDPNAPGFDCGKVDCWAIRKDVWARNFTATNAANDKCRFTAFHAYEYTGNTGLKNIHRNVIFADDKVVEFPLDYVHYPTVGKMLQAFDSECGKVGCRAVIIPHSSNDSAGEKWVISSAMEASLRAKWEVLAEIYQHKGSSECLNATSDPKDDGYDPGCEFELATVLNGVPDRTTDPPGYVRAGLSKGLETYATTKQDPLRLGIVASTDTHNTTPGGTSEQGWHGHNVTQDDTPTLRLTGGQNKGNQYFGPGGLAVVWAEENTRASIFAALARRETYGTSGTRIVLRFYQTFDTTTDFCKDPAFPKQLVDGGAVPMGGLVKGVGKRPRFVVYAMKDGQNLAEIDLVQSVVVSGKARERVFRVMAKDATNGDASMCATFDAGDEWAASAPAYWYTRVLEKETWRWSHYDCLAAPGTSTCAAQDKKIQERAWSSPVFQLP